MAGMDSFEQQAFDLILSRSKEVFDVSKEDAKTRERYGPKLGEQLLTARRLCEAGAGFVTVSFGGWDMHGNIGTAMKNLGPKVDQAVSASPSSMAARFFDAK